MLQYIIFQNTVQEWLIAACILIVSFAGMLIVKKLLIRQFQGVARRTFNAWDDLVVELIEKTGRFFILAVSIYAASLILSFHQTTTALLQKIAILSLLLQLAIWGSHILAFWSTRYKEQQLRINSSALKTLLRMGSILRVVLWTFLVLLALDNLGVDITTLVAGLGITGIAVALAVQNILKDLLSALSIVLDKPFEVGDFIIVDSYMGSIERIGVKTTRIRSISGELLIFSNSGLLQSRIRNYKHMYERRVVFSLNITYDTPIEKVAALPAMLKDIVASKDQVRFDRAHFKAYGDSALEYEIVYWMQDPDYNLYMDTQQAINLEILHQFEREGIQFAFPTQTLQVQTVAPPAISSDEQPAFSSFFSHTEPVIHIRTKRASDKPASSDGTRILVDGYWPPGVKKEDAAIDLWLKEIAPSSRLRSWFGHDPEKWAEFQQRYANELDQKPVVVKKLLELVRAGTITLVYGAHNTKINTAVALGKYIRKHLKH
jgi:small-conductance mechanosensitive channel/uncharacterized protein YeaO (DUF488 family)